MLGNPVAYFRKALALFWTTQNRLMRLSGLDAMPADAARNLLITMRWDDDLSAHCFDGLFLVVGNNTYLGNHYHGRSANNQFGVIANLATCPAAINFRMGATSDIQIRECNNANQAR